jgi:hypothetical protein
VTRRRVAVEVGLAAVAGWCVMAVPYLGDTSARQGEAAFLPFMAGVVERMGSVSILLLLFLGVAFGVVGRVSPWVLGFAAVATLPAWSAVDMVMGGGQHNLWPFEWLAYVFYGVVTSLGAFVGRARTRAV